jgi:hypothetical protein
MPRSPWSEYMTRCGSIETSAFSFYANKIITTGRRWCHLDPRLRNGPVLSKPPFCLKRFYHTELNHRMTNMQAALGGLQMERTKVYRDQAPMRGYREKSRFEGTARWRSQARRCTDVLRRIGPGNGADGET